MVKNTIRDAGPFRRPGISDYIKRWSKPVTKPHRDTYAEKVLHTWGVDLGTFHDQPRNLYDPDQLFEHLWRYGEVQTIEWDEHLQAGFDLAFKLFARPKHALKLQKLDLITVAKNVDLSKSAGLPFLTKKREVLSYALDRAKQVIRGEKAPNPCIAYARTQQNKTRLVWGYPFEMTLIEGRYALPLIDALSAKVMPIKMSRWLLGTKLTALRHRSKYIYALDYSKFDQTIPALLISKAFRILETWFDIDEDWHLIKSYFIKTPIVMPDGHLYVGKNHGVPSGSFFTQIIDSIVNLILIGALSHRFNLNLFHRDIFVLGDDSIFGSFNRINLEQIANFLRKYYIIMNPDKSRTDLHFLGTDWRHAFPRRPVEEIISRILYPERYRVYNHYTDVYLLWFSYASVYLDAWKIRPRIFLSGIPHNPLSWTPYSIRTEQNQKHLVNALSGYYAFRLRQGFTRQNADLLTSMLA